MFRSSCVVYVCVFYCWLCFLYFLDFSGEIGEVDKGFYRLVGCIARSNQRREIFKQQVHQSIAGFIEILLLAKQRFCRCFYQCQRKDGNCEDLGVQVICVIVALGRNLCLGVVFANICCSYTLHRSQSVDDFIDISCCLKVY